METVFGIDLGTSNVLVAAWSEGTPRCVVGAGGGCPPVVAFGPNGPIVGSQAALRAQLHPETAIPRWKWLLGRMAVSRAARRAASAAGLNLVQGDAGEACVVAAGAVRNPVDLAGYALRHAVDAAIRATGETPAEIVVGVPAVFDVGQRSALSMGAQRSGLAIERFVRDTTAIGLAEFDAGLRGLVAIVDAGAAKLEIAVCNVSPTSLEIVGRRSDAHTGADDLDAKLCEWLLAEIEQRTGDALEEDARVGEFLRQEVAAARRMSGASAGAPLVVRTPFLEGVEGRGLDASWEVPRARLTLLAAESVERVAGLCTLALSDAGVGAEGIQRVYLTGGLGRVAEIRARIESVWKRPCVLAPEGSVARGAALFGAALRGRVPMRFLHEEPVPEGTQLSGSNFPSVGTAPGTSPSGAEYPVHTAVAPSVRPSAPPSASSFVPHAPSMPATSMPATSMPATSMPATSTSSTSTPAVSSSTPSTLPDPPRSVAPVREYASSIPPAPGTVRPMSTGLSVAKAGRFKGVVTASDLLAMPLNRPATPMDLSPPALPLVLLYYGTLKDLSGVLTFKHGEETAPVLLYRGTPTMGPSERARAQRAFVWKDGDYSFAPSADVAPSAARRREPVAAFILSGLRPTLRAMMDADVSLALANRIGQSPVVPPERQPRVERLGLTETEGRLVAHQFDGTRALAEMFDGNPLGRQTLARLVLVLDTFGAVEWRQPKPPIGEDPREMLARRLERMRDQNHFDVVGVHWSVNLSEINVAYEKFRAMYIPGTALAKSAPEMCRAILDRGAEAYTILSSDAARLKYRKATFPEIDSDLLAPLLASRANALAMKGEMGEANDMHRLLNEVSPKDAMSLQAQLRQPGIPTRPVPPKDIK